MSGRLRRRHHVVTAGALAAVFAATGCSRFPFMPEPTPAAQAETEEPERRPRQQRQPRPDVIPGRPVRGRRRPILLPDPRVGASSDDARAEYASVASFGELALRLIGVGAPTALVEACHRAALDEISHARTVSVVAGEPDPQFGAMPRLLGRRVGRRWRSRSREIASIAVETFLDGWINESAAAAALRTEVQSSPRPEDRVALLAVASDEDRHAALARDIVTWCHGEEPVAVGRALAATPPLRSWGWATNDATPDAAASM